MVKENPFDWARRHGIKTIRLGIFQPKIHSELQEDTISLEELEAFAAVLQKRALRVEEAKAKYKVIPIADWNATYLNQTPNAEECAWCRVQATCPSATRVMEEFLMMGFDEVLDPAKEKPANVLPERLGTIDEMDGRDARNALLGKLMKIAPFAEDMITAVRAETERTLLLGEEVPGFGLDQGRKGARKFTDEEAVEQMLSKQMRIATEHTHKKTLKTPTQLEKLTKGEDGQKPVLGERQWQKLVALVTQSDPKPTVKPAHQIKNPYTPPKPDSAGFDAVPQDAEDDIF